MNNLDLGYLEDITGGDSEVMIEMINLLLEETPKHLKSIKLFLENEEWLKLGAEAHKLKPMLMYVGLTRLNKAAQNLESYAKKEENLEDIPGLVQQLEEGFLEVVEELKEKKAELE